MKQALISALLLLLFACPALAEAPVKLSDVNDMIRQGSSVEEVLLAMNERGVGFRLTASAERKLVEWGFSDMEIAYVQGISVGKKYVPEGEAKPDEPAAPADPNAPAGNPNDPNDKDAYPIGHGHGPQYVDIMDEVLGRTVKAVGYNDYSLHKLDRAALYCSKNKSKDVLTILAEIEKKFVASFPACLSNATHPRATLFVVADNKGEFQNFFRILLQSYDKQWPGYARGVDFREEHQYWIMSNAVVVNAEAYQNAEDLKRVLAFGWGYMTISQTSNYACPESLATGFGNVLEARVAGTPFVTLLPESGEEDEAIDNWKSFVQTQLANKKLEQISKVFEWSVTNMHHREYAVAWSLAEDLVKDPLKLYHFLDGNTNDNTPHTEQLTEAYETNLEAMHQRWAQTIAGQ